MYITGKGRCNVTNASDMEQYQRNIFRNPRFLYAAFARLDNNGLMALLDYNEAEKAILTETAEL
jgi:predicted flavoprotein YhiN